MTSLLGDGQRNIRQIDPGSGRGRGGGFRLPQATYKEIK